MPNKIITTITATLQTEKDQLDQAIFYNYLKTHQTENCIEN